MPSTDSTRGKSAAKPATVVADGTTPGTTPVPLKQNGQPYKDFPLFYHASRQWAKKVRGKLLYFGTDPIKARNKWLREKDDLLARRTPRVHDADALSVEDLCLSIEDLCNLFMESREGRMLTGEITQMTYEDYYETVKHLAKHWGRTAAVEHLVPDDFLKLRVKLAKGFGLKTLDGRIRRTRAVFNHASKNGWLEMNLNKLWGTEFQPQSKTAISKANGDTIRLFTREEIQALLGKAGPQLKAMILVALNSGYGHYAGQVLTDCDRCVVSLPAERYE